MIAGSSLIVRLERYLQTQKEVFQLPLPVTFISKAGLRIAQLRPLLDQAMSPPPELLVLHLGANDIGRLNSWQWFQELEVSITYLRARYPATTLIWSDMLPRATWRYGNGPEGAEKARRRNQRRARLLVSREQGAIIRHPLIKADAQCLLGDGVHLTDFGLEHFRVSLEDGLMMFLSQILN